MPSPLNIARSQLASARDYTRTLLTDLDDSLWYTQPPGCPTNIAWQVAHLAFAEYALVLVRVRGKEPDDELLVSNGFWRRYKKGSEPSLAGADEPTPAELRATLDRVHDRCLTEMASFTDSQLGAPVPEPYSGYPNKLGSLLFCSAHEMLHAGQIGLVRRMLGKKPVR